jgi:hypothetical protein
MILRASPTVCQTQLASLIFGKSIENISQQSGKGLDNLWKLDKNQSLTRKCTRAHHGFPTHRDQPTKWEGEKEIKSREGFLMQMFKRKCVGAECSPDTN